MAELSQEHRSQLDGIVLKMSQADAPEADVRAIVDDFTKKYADASVPPGPRKRNEGAGKPKTQETLEQGLSREGPIMRTLFTPVKGAIQAGTGVKEIATEPTMRGKARGASDVIRGGLQMASPYAAGALVTAPLKTFMMLAAGGAAQETVEKGGEYVGIPEEYRDLGGDVAGILAGGATARGLRGRGSGGATSQPPGGPVRPPLREVAKAAYRGAKASSTAPATLRVKGLPVQLPVPAWAAGAGVGYEVGEHLPIPGAGPVGAVVGAAVPGIRGGIKAAREVYRPTPPPSAAETSLEAYEANKGKAGKVSRKYTPGGSGEDSGYVPPRPAGKAKTIRTDTPPEPWTPVRGKASPSPGSYTPESDYTPPRSVKAKGLPEEPAPEPETKPEPWKPFRASKSRRSYSSNSETEYGPAPASRAVSRAAPPAQAEQPTATPPASGGTSPTGYSVLPPIRYESEVALKVSRARDAVVDKLAGRSDAGELAAKPREWWRKNYKKLGLKTPPSEETLQAFLEKLGWKSSTPPE